MLKLLYHLHIVDQIKLIITNISLTNAGIILPIKHVIIDTIFKGNKQYPSRHTLWKKDLNF